jgi:tRNA(fMet)-specific endonuclease VapC
VFVFDTDRLSILHRKNEPELSRIFARMGRYNRSTFFVSIISFQEEVAGWNRHLARARAQRDVVFGYEMLRNVIADFAALQVLDYDEMASQKFIALKKQNTRVGTMDLRIAAVTLTNEMTLLTRNTVDFERVPGLRTEVWTLPLR